MKWFRRKPEPPAIPTYQPPAPLPLFQPKPVTPPCVIVRNEPKRKDEGIEVEEVDTSDMTKTGVHRAWDRLAGKFK